MAKITEHRIKENRRNPEFRKRLEEAKGMVQQGKRPDGVDHILKHMNDKDESNHFRFHYIPNRRLAEMLDIPDPARIGEKLVWRRRQRLKKERFGTNKNNNEKVDTSKMSVIGKGSESVYLYYFPEYKFSSILYNKYIDDSHETFIYKCNIGRTIENVIDRVSAQIGQQLPEKAKIALIIQTDDCEALETEIHDELKRKRKWLDPKHNDVVGKEWFLTNPAEVVGIVKSIHSTNGENLKKGDGHSTQT